MDSLALVSIATGKVATFVRPDLPAGYAPPEGYQLVPDTDLPPGWQREVPALPVPAEVPLWSFREVLLEDGLLDTVLGLVEAMPDPVTKARIKNFLEYGNFVNRTSPALAGIAAALNKTPAEVDEFFRRAAAKSL